MMDPSMLMEPPLDAPAPPGMGPPLSPDQMSGGGLPPELVGALGGGGMASADMLAEGPMAGEETEMAEEDAGEEDPISMVREAISLLRRAGDLEPDDQRSHMIDKVQADLQKILASEAQKTDKLRAALG